MVDKIPEEIQSILDEYWVCDVPQRQYTLFNSIFIFGIAASEYSKLKEDCIMVDVLGEKVKNTTKPGRPELMKWEKERKCWIDNVDELPEIWKLWFQGKLTFHRNGMLVKKTEGKNIEYIDNPAMHLRELISLHKNVELHKKLRETWLG